MKIMGADCSTNSFAFAIIEDGKLIHWGEVGHGKGDIMHRAHNANNVARELTFMEEFQDIDAVFYESSVFVNNRQTVIKLAQLLSAAIAPFAKPGVPTEQVSPITWQSFIGNKVLTKAEKDKIKAENPGQKSSWYAEQGRAIRKQRTIDWVKQEFGVEIKSDNISDAIGVAFYGYHNK